MTSIRTRIAGLLKSMTIEHLWALTVVAGIFAFLNTHPIRPHDFWWHMAIGREIAASGQIPTVDTYSFTATGTPYPSYQAFWLMDLFLYGVYTLGGPVLIVLTHSLVITGAYALLLWLATRTSGSWRMAALGTLFATALGINDWNVRPQAITFIIAAGYLLVLHTYRHTLKQRWLLVFPLGMLLWVNSHGTFPLGLLLLGFWFVDEGWQALLAARSQGRAALKRLGAPASSLAITTAACLVSPQGVRTFAYVRGMSVNPIIRNLVPEWAPATFESPTGKLFLFGLLFTAVLLALSPKRPTLFQILSFGAFAALGLSTIRGAVWFGIVMAPVVADHLTHLTAAARSLLARRLGVTLRPTARSQPALNGLFAGVLLVGVLATLPWAKSWLPLREEKAGLISSETPLQATEALLEARPPGPLFHEMAFGSYLAWAAQPHYPVFVDSRIELYPPSVWLDYLTISAAQPGWEARLARYGIRSLLIAKATQAPLIEAVETSDGWTRLYTDEVASLYTAPLD